MPFDGVVWLQVQAAVLVLVAGGDVWYLPIAGYLMLVSVWARRNVFLWAVLPPVAVMLLEKLFLQFASTSRSSWAAASAGVAEDAWDSNDDHAWPR